MIELNKKKKVQKIKLKKREIKTKKMIIDKNSLVIKYQ